MYPRSKISNLEIRLRGTKLNEYYQWCILTIYLSLFCHLESESLSVESAEDALAGLASSSQPSSPSHNSVGAGNEGTHLHPELTLYSPNYLKADLTCRKLELFCSVKLMQNHGILKIMKKSQKIK